MADRLSRSILTTVCAYLAFQSLLFAAFAVPAGFLSRYGFIFIAVSALFHAFLLFLLFVFKSDFVKESTGERLDRVNLANRITLFRVSTLPTLLFLVMAAKDYRIRIPLMLIVVVVFTTDFVDGYISRRGGEVTRIGRMMDSASDYSLLIVLTIVFYYFEIIPKWLFILVVFRLGLQTALLGALIAVRRRIEPKTSILGKVAVASIMMLYAAEILRLVSGIRLPAFFLGLELAVAVVIVASSADKVLMFTRDLRTGEAAGLDNGSKN
jgi:cardiolipin synthase